LYSKGITEHKQAVELVSKNEELLRSILENSRDGINLLDLKTGKYSIMSASQVTLTGFSADEILNITCEEALDRMHPDDRHISIKQQEEIANGDSSLGVVEYRWKVKSGEYRWFSDSRNVIRNKKGEAIGLVGNSRDITELKKTEKELSLHSEIMKNISEGINLIRVKDEVIVFTNSKFDKMFGYYSEENMFLSLTHLSVKGLKK
jgi:PAS domain S-box-containing protein